MQQSDSISFKSFSSEEGEVNIPEIIERFDNHVTQHLNTLRLDVRYVCMTVEKITLNLEVLEKSLESLKKEQLESKLKEDELHSKAIDIDRTVSQIQEDVSKLKNNQVKREVTFDLDRSSSQSTENIDECSQFSLSLNNRRASGVSSTDPNILTRRSSLVSFTDSCYLLSSRRSSLFPITDEPVHHFRNQFKTMMKYLPIDVTSTEQVVHCFAPNLKSFYILCKNNVMFYVYPIQRVIKVFDLPFYSKLISNYTK